MRSLFHLGFVCLLSIGVSAQQVEVSRSNKTIAVTAEESVSVDADVATLTVASENYGTTVKEAYDANLRSAAAIIKALKEAGVREEAIETGRLSVTPVDPDDVEHWTPAERKLRQFVASQSWEIRASAKEVQNIADTALRAGANRLEDIDWEVSDRAALQAAAGKAALAKARRIAEEMANGLGAKLGELVYASNRAPVTRFFAQYWAVETHSVQMSRGLTAPSLILFPQQVKETATVHAVFSVE